MTKENIEISKLVLERKELWGAVRRAAPIQHIRRVMREKKVLNKDLAERLGVTEASISRLLRGAQNLQLDTLYMLADALGEQICITVGAPEIVQTDSAQVTAHNVAHKFHSESDNVFHLKNYTRTMYAPRKEYRASFG